MVKIIFLYPDNTKVYKQKNTGLKQKIALCASVFMGKKNIDTHTMHTRLLST